MRSRLQVTEDMITAARPSEPDKYQLRLLKAELLTVELLLDVRELLQQLQPPTIINHTEVNPDANQRLRDKDNQHP